MSDKSKKAAFLVSSTGGKPTKVSMASYAVFTPARFSTKEVECWKLNSTGGMYKTSYTEWTRTAAANVKLYSVTGTLLDTITMSSNTSGAYSAGYQPEETIINKAVLEYRTVSVAEHEVKK